MVCVGECAVLRTPAHVQPTNAATTKKIKWHQSTPFHFRLIFLSLGFLVFIFRAEFICMQLQCAANKSDHTHRENRDRVIDYPTKKPKTKTKLKVY